ncbi:hypothetical protein TNCV_3861771 [Trichonephila clavipes]|nr:hypothetical protein TNCV_3861771 [Trichonephila clavipes]
MRPKLDWDLKTAGFTSDRPSNWNICSCTSVPKVMTTEMETVAAIRDISRSCLDLNDFTVLNCIVKGHASLSPPSLRLRLCSRFTLLAT